MSNGSDESAGAQTVPPTTRRSAAETVPVPTAAEDQQAASTYGLRRYTDGQSPFIRMLDNLVNDDPNSVDVLDPATVQNLRNGLSPRSAPPPPAAYYPGMSHQQLYDAVTQDVSADQVGSTASSWNQSSRDLIDASQSTAAQALATSEQAWRGQAGDAARSAVAGLANQLGQAGQAAQVSAQLYEQQSEALSTATHTIPPPPAHPFDVAAARQQLMTTTNPFAFVALAHQDHAEFDAQQAAHQQAVTVVSTYDRVLTQTSRNQPGYGPASPAVSPGQRVSVAAGPPMTTQGGRGQAPRPSAHGVLRAGPTPAVGGTALIDTTPSASPVPPRTPAGSTTTGNVNDSGDRATGQTELAASQRPESPAPSQPLSSPESTAPGGVSESGGVYATSSIVGTPIGAGRIAGSSQRLVDGEPRGSGSSLTGRTGPDVANSRGSAAGSGARPGIATGAEEFEQNAVTGGAAVGRAGTGMAAVPGGRADRSEEDREHQRAEYLQEPDVESLFGPDQSVIPPVIGG